ncbi:IS3 family transposase [Hafnia alvei]|uniref:IS3 family transposase n=1 Tax=Hafnia alvei TaxID=569 RepID=UPI00345C9CB7
MTQIKKTNRKFSPEFKLEAIEQVIRHHQRVVDIARALELDPSQLCRWIRQYKAEMSGITLPGTVALTPEQREIQQLKARIKQLEMEKEIPKAGGRADERVTVQTCALITRLSQKWPVAELCRLLKISRSGYYASLHKTVDVRRMKLRSRLRELHAESRGSAGSRTLSTLLRQENLNVGRWLARRLMKECDLVSCQLGEHRYRGCKEESAASSNLLRRAFSPSVPNQAWCGDISYLRINGGWCYLAVVMELNSRRVVGSAISGSPDAELVCKAMRNALESRHIRGRLLFHSDQGSQYSSKKFRQLLWRNGVVQSMSRRGHCWDNAPMERFFRSLKSEWVPRRGYRDTDEAMADISRWVSYYNTRRPHTHNGGVSPCEYENQWKRTNRVS